MTTEHEIDTRTARMFATPDGAWFLNYMEERDIPCAYLAAEIKARIRRMRAVWGDLSTPV